MLSLQRRRLIAALLAGMLLASSLGSVTAPATSAQAKLRVLYLTQSKGFKHAVLPESEKVMQELGEKHGLAVTVSQDAAAVITPAHLKNLDVVIFYTTGELPLSEEQKAAFLNFIKAGKAFIGIHSATDTFYQWPEYGELIGGYFDGHPWNEEVGLKVEDGKHPATRHLPPAFRLADEIYQFKNFSRERVRVLLSLDPATSDMTKRNIKAKEFPLVWWRPYGKGRVFYCALGHRPEVWRDAGFQTLLVSAIRWSAGKLK
jgi:type 1 glutamine amidotransferase